MRISTGQMYQRGLSNLLVQQERVAKLQEQLASGLKVKTPSDDPIASGQIERMSQKISQLQSLQKNRQNAESALGFEESILGNTTTVLNRLREIQVQAGNSALSEGDRKALAKETQVLLNQLQEHANTKDSAGNYLFSGGKTVTQPLSLNGSGQYVYNGDSTQRHLPVTGSLQMAINDTGDNLFMKIRNGNGQFTVHNGATPNLGTGSVTTGSVVNQAVYVADDYTLTFANNSSGQLVVMVSGAVAGPVIPPTGLPDDAPIYQEGGVVSFNGMEISTNGAPKPGDTFLIEPSKNESMFSTVQRMIANLNKPFNTAVEKSATQTENNQLLAQLDGCIANILNYQSELGARLSQLESVEGANANLIDLCTQAQKQLRETDPVQVATDYNMQLVNLQVAQQSFAKIQGLSLFNYI